MSDSVMARQIFPSRTVLCVSAVIFAATCFVPSAAVAAAPASEFGVACAPSVGNDPDRTYDDLLSAPQRFVFQQQVVADEVGAKVVDFTREGAQASREMVVVERERRGVTPWCRPEWGRDRP